MTTIMPKQKRVQDALTWISQNKEVSDSEHELVQEAIFRFNLTPKEEEYLNHLFSKEKSGE